MLLLHFFLPGPLLVWDSSVIGGSASSWIVGTDASRPGARAHTHTHIFCFKLYNYTITINELDPV